MNDLSFSRSASLPTNRPELAPRENNCLACVYTVVWVVVVVVVGVDVCRGVRGVKDLPPTCTRCFGVIGGDSSASRYRGLEGVLNWTGSVFSSAHGLALAHDSLFCEGKREELPFTALDVVWDSETTLVGDLAWLARTVCFERPPASTIDEFLVLASSFSC